MVPSPPLSSSWRPLPLYPIPATPDPLAHACLNSGDLTAEERSSAARSRSPLLGPDRTARTMDNASHTRALTPWPTCQRPSPLALGPLGQFALPLCR
jgi:hypothetical protein